MPTLDAWTLKPSDFCNVGVNIERPSAERETPGSLLVADDENINFRALYLSCFRDEWIPGPAAGFGPPRRVEMDGNVYQQF